MASRESLFSRLEMALHARNSLLDPSQEGSLRLFNGFYEGAPELAIDLYARTLLIHDYASPPMDLAAARPIVEFYLERLPWITAAVLKSREAVVPAARRGTLMLDTPPDRKVREGAVWYALELTRWRDAGLFLDTRGLRAWAFTHLSGKTVLNTFAYTGSLGVAAAAGGADQVVHLDRSHAALDVARASYDLNSLPTARDEFLAEDFFPATARMRRAGRRFDCVFLDPPFFATSPRGRVDLERSPARLINKVRPLVEDGGWLVAVNNALFVSGAEYLKELEALCADGYMTIEELIPVPADFTGFPETRVGAPPVDPAPFNHPTKIAVMRVRRKEQ